METKGNLRTEKDHRAEKDSMEDNEGQKDSLQMKCLKPKDGSGITLENTLTHLPDNSLVSLADVIAGPT